jgi:hypothetical protein
MSFTTRANIKSLQRSIPLGQLPQTLKEAMEAARTLGFLYLWIDCLCIIQDDKNDREVESAKIGWYYRQAKLTIADGDGKTATEGCYTPRNPDTVRPCKVLVSLASSQDRDDSCEDLYLYYSSSHQRNSTNMTPESNLQLR